MVGNGGKGRRGGGTKLEKNGPDALGLQTSQLTSLGKRIEAGGRPLLSSMRETQQRPHQSLERLVLSGRESLAKANNPSSTIVLWLG